MLKQCVHGKRKLCPFMMLLLKLQNSTLEMLQAGSSLLQPSGVLQSAEL